jgi:RimJ/RimL family protein N-acetyltransferase
MAGVMELCGMAICPPSSVSFEYASIGGLLFLKQIADNQIEVKKYFIEQQLAFDYEMDFPRVLHSDLYHESLRVVKNQHNVFDGKSDERLKAIFKMLGIALKLSFRKADSEDLMICFEWANDPEVRRLSYNSDPIALEDHIRWFHNKIKSPNTHFYIIEYSSKPIGQIRFEGTDELIISYLISSEMRGKGLGSLILKEGVKTIIKNSEKVRNISGYVKEENIPSCKAFEKAGFLKSSSSEIPYPNSVKYEMLINP